MTGHFQYKCLLFFKNAIVSKKNFNFATFLAKAYWFRLIHFLGF